MNSPWRLRRGQRICTHIGEQADIDENIPFGTSVWSTVLVCAWRLFGSPWEEAFPAVPAEVSACAAPWEEPLLGRNKSLTFEAKSICVLKVKGSDLSKKERSFGNFKNLVSASKKDCRARSTKNGATNSVTKCFFCPNDMQPATIVVYTLRYVCAWYPHCNVARYIYVSNVRRFSAAQLDCVETPLKQLFM